MNSCKDQALVNPRVANSSNLLRLDGYYYHSPSGIDSTLTVVDFLYGNGISLKLLGTQSKDFLNIEKDIINSKSYTKNKLGWGVYLIENNKIKIENWVPTEGKRKTSIRNGDIINDSTFIITNFFSAFTQKNYSISETYHFRQFSPKPDSTNKWIK